MFDSPRETPVDSRKLLGRVSWQLCQRDITFDQFAQQVGYEKRELSDALYRKQLKTSDYIYQDVVTWLEMVEGKHV